MLRPRIRLSFCLVAVVLSAVPAKAGDAAMAAKLASLSERLEQLRIAKTIGGMSVAVVADQEIVFARGYGYMDGENQRPATADTAYWIASATKPLTATMFLRLASRKLIDLDSRMALAPGYTKWCERFATSNSIFAKNLDCAADLTVRHVLSHMVSGKPGESFSYNPAVFSQLQRVIRGASSRPLSVILHEQILDPAGMNDTAAGWYDANASHVLTRLAQPRVLTPNGDLESSRSTIWDVGTSAGVISTVRDLARFDIALDRGKFVSAADRQTMFQQVRGKDGALQPFGIGWYVQQYRGQKIVWHSGWEENCYSAIYLKVPDRNLTFIILANTEGVWWGNSLDKAEIEKSPFAAAFWKPFCSVRSRSASWRKVEP